MAPGARSHRRGGVTDLFDADLTGAQFARFDDARRWPGELRAAAGRLEPVWLSSAGLGLAETEPGGALTAVAAADAAGNVALPAWWGTAGVRPVFYLGSEEGRERIWLQCDTAADGRALAVAAAAILRSLTGEGLSRYRPLLMGRARIAVLPPWPVGIGSGADDTTPARAGSPRSLRGVPPLLDTSALSQWPGLLAAMDGFAPTLVIHVQDWGGEAGEWTGTGSGEAGNEAPVALAGAGLRLVESFFLAPELHQRLGEGGARRTWLGRPTPLARALAGHPDARTGADVRRHVTRMGYRVFDTPTEKPMIENDPTWPAALRLAPGRYIPRLEWRRLGATSLGEVALDRYGALGLCGQTFDNPATERAGAALAMAEAALIYRLGLST